MCVIRTAPATISSPPYVRSCEREHAPAGHSHALREKLCERVRPPMAGHSWPHFTATGAWWGGRAACVFF